MAMTKKRSIRLAVEALEDRCMMSVAPLAPRSAPDWFDSNLKDANVRSLVRSLDADHNLSRSDMMAVFRQASKDGRVTTVEYGDLRTLVNNPSRLGTPDYVENLAGKVVNGDPANARYQGKSLGNLRANSTGTQLNNLVNKWFLGADHPQTSYAYQRAVGALFDASGPSYQDVRQGYLGDCYLLASLGESALRLNSSIRTMFIDNGDQTWTVRYYASGKATYVTVDRYLPTYGNGRFIFANMGDPVSNTQEVLWVALAEKAYAQLNESGVLNRRAANTYAAIEGGYIGDALQQICGVGTYVGRTLDFNAIVSAWNTGALIGFASKGGNPPYNVVGNHAYALVGYNAVDQTFTVFNPWGMNNGHDPGLLTLTWAQVVASFGYWDSSR